MDKKKFPLVSINGLNCNDKKTILKAHESAVSQTYPNLEIIIVDNHSNDGTKEELERKIPLWEKERKQLIEKLYPGENWPVRIRLIKNAENRGFAPGHNQMIHLCQGDFILCLNADAILSPDFVSKIIRVFFEYPEVGAIQGKLIRYDFDNDRPRPHPDKPTANIIDTTGLVILKNRRIVNRGQGEADQGQYEKTTEIFGADGALPVYRRAALEDIKMPLFNRPDNLYQEEYFDEDFYLYKEDVDLAWRLRLCGWKTIYLPQAVAYHGRGAGDSMARSYRKIIEERKKINPRAKYYSFKNQRLMQIKNELPGLFLRHLPQFLIKEIGAWLYVIFFEPFTLKMTGKLISQMPLAFKKRKIIKRQRRITTGEMTAWFE